MAEDEKTEQVSEEPVAESQPEPEAAPKRTRKKVAPAADAAPETVAEATEPVAEVPAVVEEPVVAEVPAVVEEPVVAEVPAPAAAPAPAPVAKAAKAPAAKPAPKKKVVAAAPKAKPKRVKPAERKPIVRLPKPEGVRGRTVERRGVVVSDKMDKTIVVKVDTIKAHPRYQKVVRRSTKFHAHDERNEAKVGDVVRIAETRPLSATKHWRLVEIVEVAK